MYQVNPINAVINKAASASWARELNSGFRGPDLANHTRINGATSKMAIALLPHQIFQAAKNDGLKPEATSVPAPMVAPSIALNNAEPVNSPKNSLRVARSGFSATNRCT